MKLIQALKQVKMNKEKVVDLQNKIAAHCANLSNESPLYGDNTEQQVSQWVQSCKDIAEENVRLLVAIQTTNIQTPVTIELGGKAVTKSIAAWVWHRREYADMNLRTVTRLTDRGLKGGFMQTSVQGAEPIKVDIIRHFDPEKRDEQAEVYRQSPFLIDAALEMVNAVTDLIE